MSLRQDVEIWQGEWVEMPLTVYSNAEKTEIKGLGSASIDYRIGYLNKDELVLRITGVPNANGSVASVIDPSQGLAKIVLRSADTQALQARRYTHQVIVTDSAGKPNVVTHGNFTVNETLPDV